MKMKAEYIIRFDDICPTMNWDVWNEIEKILIEFDIKPIIAVVPDNKDEKLQVATAEPEFWEKVSKWQKMGWGIALHGFQHTYVTQQAGLIGLNDRSEFAGLTYQEQEIKLQKAVEIFRKEGIEPQLWVAPAHSFDINTVKILKKLSIDIISDGYYLWPHTDSQGILWVPQQLWGFRNMPLGVWTICYHHNNFTKEDLSDLRKKVLLFKDSIISVNQALEKYKYRHKGLLDILFAWGYYNLVLNRKSRLYTLGRKLKSFLFSRKRKYK